MKTDNRLFPVAYMFVITVFFSSIVIGFTRFARERVEANEQRAFEKAVLAVLPGLYEREGKVSGLELHKLFKEKVSGPDKYSAGAYTLKDDGKMIIYALPIIGQGFWAQIKGVIGIESDKKTITGIAFYQQNETPGLGAEIAKPEFRNQFKGKVISMGEKPIICKRPGARLDKNSVHAVTGATQTSVRLEKIINDALKEWQKQLTYGIEQ